MATLYLTFGPTHSGKTTFGRKLLANISQRSKAILVDNDSVDSYLKAHFNNLRTDPDVLRTRTPSNPDLRLRIPQLITDYALAENYNVIVTASHSKKEIRMQYYRIAKCHNADVVLLMFGASEDEILSRIKKSARENLSLRGESFEDLLRSQSSSLERPSTEENALYSRVLEINEHNTTEVLESLAQQTQPCPPYNEAEALHG